VDLVVAIVAVLVAVGLALGGLPGLRLDRAGVVLVGAAVLVGVGAVPLEAAWAAIDVGTVALLFGLMVLSSLLQISGWMDVLAARLAAAPVGPLGLLGGVVVCAGALSALLTNDVVVLALVPALVAGCRARGLDPTPQVLGLAAASNVGSVATLVGNPQNMLVGEVLGLGFAAHLRVALLPAVVGLAVVWAVIGWVHRGALRGGRGPAAPAAVAWDRGEAARGLVLLGLVLLGFLTDIAPRGAVALLGAAAALLGRRAPAQKVIDGVDFRFLVLVMGLFVVQHAIVSAGAAAAVSAWVSAAGLDPGAPAVLYGLTAALGNLVSNVPAVMLLLPFARGAEAGTVLIVSSTFAGNLLILSSLANILAVEAAARQGVRIGAATHARVGVPITGLTLLLGAWAVGLG
jgi:Na+/H+ antiporter NhaD/arsenite permease-like protein